MTRDELLAAYARGERDFQGANLRGADLSRAGLRGANLSGADLSWANLSGADLSWANLRGADLSRAGLRGANLREAGLRGASLRGANLSGADLSGADLSGADLRGADLGTQWIILGPMRSDGYHFFLTYLSGETEPRIKAGCRDFSLPEAWEHWRGTRGGTALGEETFAILTYLEAAAKARGLM